MFTSINQFFKKYPWVPNVMMSLIGIVVSAIVVFINADFKAISRELVDSLREIRVNTRTLTSSLKENLNGGINVVVGVNPKEIKENIAYVYENNTHGLKPGDVIILKNYTDNTFQASLRFIVQKSLPAPQENKTSAAIFIGEEAAKRLGFYDYRSKGTIMLKMQRQGGTEKEKESNAPHTP